MVMSVRTWRARAAGVTVLLLGLAYAVQIPRLAGHAAYLGVLVGSAVVVALLAAVRLWSGGHMDGRIMAASLAVAGLSGHLLNYLEGVPGASALHGHVSTPSVVAIGLELATLALLVLDALRRPAPSRRRHPYAL